MEEAVHVELLQPALLAGVGKQAVLAEQRLPLERVDQRGRVELAQLLVGHAVAVEGVEQLSRRVLAVAAGPGDARRGRRRERVVGRDDARGLGPARGMARPGPGCDEQVEAVPAIRRALEAVVGGKARAVRLLQRCLDVLALLLPVDVRVLDGRPQVDDDVHQGALGQVPLLSFHLPALHRFGDELGERRPQLGRLGAVRDGADQQAVLQLLRVLVVHVGEEQAGGVLLLLLEELVHLLESPGTHELEVDVVRGAELAELVGLHPADPRRARAQEHPRLVAARQVRPLRAQVDEQEPDVDGDAQDDQAVDEQLAQHGRDASTAVLETSSRPATSSSSRRTR